MGKSDALARKFGANLARTVDLRAGSAAQARPPATAVDKYAGAVRTRSLAIRTGSGPKVTVEGR